LVFMSEDPRWQPVITALQTGLLDETKLR
jgi:hypothetical protein